MGVNKKVDNIKKSKKKCHPLGGAIDVFKRFKIQAFVHDSY